MDILNKRNHTKARNATLMFSGTCDFKFFLENTGVRNTCFEHCFNGQSIYCKLDMKLTPPITQYKDEDYLT